MSEGKDPLSDGIKDDLVTVSCRSCGHLYDDNSGLLIISMLSVIIKPEDRGKGNCRPCHMLQNAPDPMRDFWPTR